MVKNFMKDGKWIERTTAPNVHLCDVCDNKFIKTRYRQTTCLRCMSDHASN